MSSPYDLSEVGRSHRFGTTSGPVTFSSRLDYHQHLKKQGFKDPEQTFLHDADLVLAIHTSWHRQAAQGCRFAQLLMSDPSGQGWARHVETSELPKEDAPAWGRIAGLVDSVVVDPNAQSLSVLLPRITRTEDLIALFLGLSRFLGWSVKATDGNSNDLVKISASFEVAAGVRSWVLAFGPFDFMPRTRQAPFVELAIRPKVKPPELQSNRLNKNRKKAHLADQWMHRLKNPTTYERTWLRTQRQKTRVTGDDDKIGKGHLAALIPRKAWVEHAEELA